MKITPAGLPTPPRSGRASDRLSVRSGRVRRVRDADFQLNAVGAQRVGEADPSTLTDRTTSPNHDLDSIGRGWISAHAAGSARTVRPASLHCRLTRSCCRAVFSSSQFSTSVRGGIPNGRSSTVSGVVSCDANRSGVLPGLVSLPHTILRSREKWKSDSRASGYATASAFKRPFRCASISLSLATCPVTDAGEPAEQAASDRRAAEAAPTNFTATNPDPPSTSGKSFPVELWHRSGHRVRHHWSHPAPPAESHFGHLGRDRFR